MPRQLAGWSWFSDPRAVHADGRTFVGFTLGCGVWVGVYNHDSATWATTQVGTTAVADDHNAPALGLRTDKRLLVCWAENGGSVCRRISTNPYDVTTWQPVEVILAGRYAYVNLLRVDPGTWYLFSRRYEKNRGRTNLFVTSMDEGTTWSTPSEWVTSDGRPYAKFAVDGSRIDAAITTGHPGTVNDNSVHHAYFDGHWRTSDGTDIGLPPFTVDDFTTVYDGTAAKAWVWDIAPGPTIVFATFPRDADHRYQYATWDGAWIVREATAAGGAVSEHGAEPHYSGGIVLDHSDPGHVYLSRQAGRMWVLEHWWTDDHGKTWASKAVSRNSRKNIRPVVPRFRSRADVFWLSGFYVTYTDWITELASTAFCPDEPNGGV